MRAESLSGFCQAYREVIDRLYAASQASELLVAREVFAESLYRSYRRRSDTGPEFQSEREIEDFLESIHVDDLALASACRTGAEAAWRKFLQIYRPVIEGAARAMISDPSAASELADSLYAELYGLRQNNGNRTSPLESYHGRSTLAGWLRTVIARRAADTWRSQKPLSPIDEVPEAAVGLDSSEPRDPMRPRYLAMLCDSLKRVIAALPPSDRLRLSYYYLQGLTLAQIGSLSGEHESTVSRKIAHTRKLIRHNVEETLIREHRLSPDQVALCFEYATEDWPFNLGEVLSEAK